MDRKEEGKSEIIHGVTVQSNHILLERKQVKTDWYEKEDTVIVFMYVKEIIKEYVRVEFTESSIEVQFKTRCKTFLETHAKDSSEDLTFSWKLELLNKVCADSCTYKVYGTKLELRLEKGKKRKWVSLEEDPPVYNIIPVVLEKSTGNAEGKQHEARKSSKPTQRKKATRTYIAKSVASQYLNKQIIDQWRLGRDCNAIFRVGKEVVFAHMEVLCAVSDFFHGLVPNVQGQSPEQLDFTDVFDSSAVLRDLVGFIYGEGIEITSEKVEGLLKGSTLINLIEFTAHCVYFLLQDLQLENCLWTWNLAVTCSLAELEKICLDTAQTRFKDTISQMESTLNIPPDELCEFMKKGMIKYCTKGDLQEFITAYFLHNKHLTSAQQEMLLDLTGLAKCDVSKDLYSITTGKPENSKGSNSKTEDAVVIQSKKQKQWFVYRTETDEWLTLPETFASIRYPQERIGVFGAGAGKDLFILIGSPNVKYLNINNLQISDIPQCPLMGKEKTASETNRKKLIIRCHGDELCCVVYSRIVTEKKAAPKKMKNNDWLPNLRGKYNSVEMFYVYVQRYSFHRKKWEFDCQVYYGPDPVTKLVSLEQENARMHIVLCGTKDIGLYKYNPEEGEATRLSSYTEQNISSVKESMVFSTKDSIILSSVSHEKTLQYNTKSNTWSFLEDFQARPEHSCIYTASECEGWIYIFKEGITSKSAKFFRYDPFMKQVKELCPPPGITFDQLKLAQNRRIPSQTLDRFVPVKLLHDVSEAILSDNEITSAMKTYCQSPTDESETGDSNMYNLPSHQMVDEALYREACNISSEVKYNDENGGTVPGHVAYQEAMAERQLYEEALLREASCMYFEDRENGKLNQTNSTHQQEAMMTEVYPMDLENRENGRINRLPLPGQFACQQVIAEQEMFEEVLIKEAVRHRMFSPSP